MPSVTLLLFPEDSASLRIDENPRPVYVRVTGRRGEGVTVQAIDTPDLPPFQVPDNVVRRRTVPGSEIRTGSPGTLMRQPVSCDHNGVIRYGQVVAYTRHNFTIRTSDDSFTVPHSTVTEVAPITVFLLHRVKRVTADVVGDLEDRHNLILDRLLGQNGVRASKSIAKLLAGICDRTAHPDPSDTLTWVHPASGVECQVSVRHVIDFGYYKDGEKRVPANLINSIGDTVFDDPAARLAVPQPGAQRSAEADEFDDYLAAMDAEEADTENAPRSAPQGEDHSTITRAVAPSTGAASPLGSESVLNTRIMAALSDAPELLRYYIETQLKASSKKRPLESENDQVAKFPRLTAVSDLLQNDAYHDRSRPKEAFRPALQSRQLHVTITADEHKGKDPVEFIEISMTSPATKFPPYPGVLIRLFDFQFGIRGLSVWHFQRFDLQSRREWTRKGKINMANFGASAEVPKPTGDRSIQALSDALAVLAVYAEEFFDRTTRRLIVDAKEFCEELRSHTRWEL